ncbi:16S rRNA (guanine(966)-N(2))-methyltransferase RsmD [Sporohalobacter salinus]|uniref:16S rRNA (guanine(966)-N(2))-methyltransferase RsmD n=1 Tax=Sporohalobacter salinus TaxID=1494606 RepID=UPI0019604D91|nr:16S rRNA (guanine(966)-N(2))-methyltransferase RsmD [Sporohalobacter salinus]MBM7623328.1 16S rRNA (guanine966-N2)-methyltransferase [Sporohalobacter salinus]
MRVIAGRSKGHNLKSVSGTEVRPTIDRVKEALFNILGAEIIDIDFLDLYAGFGGLGIEALSRGAASSTFIENSSRQVKIIKENLNLTGLEKEAEVIQGDVLTQLGRFKPESFDIVVMDPPYQAGLIEPTIKKILKYNLLKEAGIISVEHHKKDEITIESTDLKLIRERNYGNTCLSLYMKTKKGE